MKFLELLERIFLPKLCALCDEAISYDRYPPVCDECLPLWKEFMGIKCRSCGKLPRYCTCLPDLVRKANRSTVAWCVFYDNELSKEVRQMFFRLKHKYDKDLIDMCTTMMKKRVISLCYSRKINYKDFVVSYTPRRKDGIRDNGFDQSQKLAISLAKKLGIPIIRCFNNVGKAEQKGLNKSERVENALKSYEYIENSIGNYQNVFLVDDILTTGSTFFACSYLLYKNGVKNVIPVVFARDNYNSKSKINGGNKNAKGNTKYYITRAIKGAFRNGTQR